SLLVIGVFFIIIFGTFWNYYSKIWRIEDFYGQKQQELSTNVPQINKFDPTIGPANAKVKIFEYGDFFCPVCQSLQPIVDQIVNLYGDKIILVYKPLPITNYPEDKNSTEAALCANEQNKFWEYRSLIFQNVSSLNQQTYLNLAKSLNLNQQIFSDCLSSSRYESVISSNIADALKFNIASVPTIYINGQKIEGLIDFDILKQAIENALNQT
ncbi:MAG: thioredoxin domain-containing protein, partial [Patescibacteria group bacterium]|nr:thioredoxin domain-containing protein [Patescibacteria group bacterium]